MACKEISASEEGQLTSGEEKEPMSTDAISEEKMKVHRGERYVHDIHIETHARSSGKLKAVDHTIVPFSLWYKVRQICSIIGVLKYNRPCEFCYLFILGW